MDEKFTKTIDDEELDEVAGGNLSETAKDIKFLNALGLNVKDNFQVVDAWSHVGINHTYYGDKNKNRYVVDDEKTARKKIISRNDAMIYAMRQQNKYLNLEDYV